MYFSEYVILSAQIHEFMLSTSTLQFDFSHVLQDTEMVHNRDFYFFPSTTAF